MKKCIAAAVLAMTASLAMAGQPEVFEARITDSHAFDYTKATVVSPTHAQAETLDGSCKFTISLIGMQNGVGQNGGGQLIGRVEPTQCFADAHLEWSTLIAFAKGVDGKAVLEPQLIVALKRRTIILQAQNEGDNCPSLGDVAKTEGGAPLFCKEGKWHRI